MEGIHYYSELLRAGTVSDSFLDLMANTGAG